MQTNPASGSRRRVIFDTDPGIDDALALAFALRCPELQVEAITTVSGNVSVDLCTRNALLVLEALAVDNPPPVAQGADRPLTGEPVNASHVHGDDGLGGITRITESDGAPRYPAPRRTACSRHAVELILEIVGSNPREITLIAVGPLTNVALALERDPTTMRGLAALIVMGGSVSGIGNVTPTAEFNFYADAEAARQVLRAGFRTTLVGLDVTERTLLPKEDLEQHLAGSKSPAARFVADISRQYFAVAEARRGHAACPLHDPLAVGVAIDPTFVRTELFEADVETEGALTTGMLIGDRRRVVPASGLPARIEACVEVDVERFLGVFLDRVLGAP
jgi:inosine-uridine nucleoside N-ribohydrolase